MAKEYSSRSMTFPRGKYFLLGTVPGSNMMVDGDTGVKMPKELEKAMKNMSEKLFEEWLYKGGDVWQQRSYDRFISDVLPHLVTECQLSVDCPDQKMRHRVWLDNVSVKSPTITEKDGRKRMVYPHECRTRKVSYCVDVYVRARHTTFRYTNKRMLAKDLIPATPSDTDIFTVKLLSIPCMVGSRWCNLWTSPKELVREDGGYFVVDGSEKVVIGQLRLAINKTFVFQNSTGKFTYTCTCRSLNPFKYRSTSTLNVLSSRASHRPSIVTQIAFMIPSGQYNLMLGHLFTLLGCESVEQQLHYIFPSSGSGVSTLAMEIASSALNKTKNATKDDILAEIGDAAGYDIAKTRKHVKSLLRNELLPHCGISTSKRVVMRKLYYLGSMVRRLVSVLAGETAPDDRDDITNKRALLCRDWLRFSQFKPSLTRTGVHGVGEVSFL